MTRGYGYIDRYNPQTATRTLLEQVQAVLNEYEEHLPLTVRQIYYRLVATAGYPKDEFAYGRLGYHIGNARRGGWIPWDAIRDGGAIEVGWQSYADVAAFRTETLERARSYSLDRQLGQPQYVELWCEAAGMVSQMETVAAPYGIPVVSNGGGISITTLHALAGRVCSRAGPTVVLHVGDFDRGGLTILDRLTRDPAAFVEQDRRTPAQAIEVERVAVTELQVVEFELATMPAKAKDLKDGWRAFAGDPDRENETCQLEALPPDQIAGLVRDAIERRLDRTVYEALLDRERGERDELLAEESG